MKRVIQTSARTDIIRRFRRYLVDENVPDVAFRFLDAVEESVNQVLAMPEAGTPKLLKNPALAGLRSWPLVVTVLFVGERKHGGPADIRWAFERRQALVAVILDLENVCRQLARPFLAAAVLENHEDRGGTSPNPVSLWSASRAMASPRSPGV